MTGQHIVIGKTYPSVQIFSHLTNLDSGLATGFSVN